MPEGLVQEQPQHCWLPPLGVAKGIRRSLKELSGLQGSSDPREAEQGEVAGEQRAATEELGTWAQDVSSC